MNLEILVVIFVLVSFCFLYFYHSIIGAKPVDTLKHGSIQPRTFCINLDKDSHRYDNLQLSYYASDMKRVQLERYPAILGSTINIEQWLSPSAMNEFYVVKKNGYRTHHYQLTSGAVGCFLSHYYLAKQLVDDSSTDTYLILEDDVQLLPSAYTIMMQELEHAPDDWDLIAFYYHRVIGEPVGKLTKNSISDGAADSNLYRFQRVDGFWGTGTYLINKKGAKKFVDEVEHNKIDGQIDAYLSRMSQQNKIRLYASNIHISKNVGRDTNIQIEINPISGMNPFDFKGFLV
jgi:GR25 family glycosyltransferase involved in LPS biosynthesis